MPDYRLYFLDRAGHIRNVVELACEDDAEAIASVELHRDGRTMELWRRDRMVHRFEAPADVPVSPDPVEGGRS